MTARIFYLMIIVLFLSASCKEEENVVDQTLDFVRFEVNQEQKMYEYKDSVYQACRQTNGTQPEFYFLMSKTFTSSNLDFQSITIEIDNISKDCPSGTLSDKSEIRFILTKEIATAEFIDFMTLERIENLTWSQQSVNNSVIVEGNFNGWIYQYFDKRQTGNPIEPFKLDSMLIENGEFRFTKN